MDKLVRGRICRSRAVEAANGLTLQGLETRRVVYIRGNRNARDAWRKLLAHSHLVYRRDEIGNPLPVWEGDDTLAYDVSATLDKRSLGELNALLENPPAYVTEISLALSGPRPPALQGNFDRLNSRGETIHAKPAPSRPRPKADRERNALINRTFNAPVEQARFFVQSAEGDRLQFATRELAAEFLDAIGSPDGVTVVEEERVQHGALKAIAAALPVAKSALPERNALKRTVINPLGLSVVGLSGAAQPVPHKLPTVELAPEWDRFVDGLIRAFARPVATSPRRLSLRVL